MAKYFNSLYATQNQCSFDAMQEYYTDHTMGQEFNNTYHKYGLWFPSRWRKLKLEKIFEYTAK